MWVRLPTRTSVLLKEAQHINPSYSLIYIYKSKHNEQSKIDVMKIKLKQNFVVAQLLFPIQPKLHVKPVLRGVQLRA